MAETQPPNAPPTAPTSPGSTTTSSSSSSDTLYKLLNLKPWIDTDLAKFNNETVHQTILQNPNAAKLTYSFEAFVNPVHPLFMCIGLGASLDVISLLHNIHPDAIKTKSGDGMTPLHYACASSSGGNGSTSSLSKEEEVVQFLINKYPQALEERDSDGLTPLHVACKYTNNCSINLIRMLVKKRPDTLMMKDNVGSCVPLHYACLYGAPYDIVRYLAEKDARAIWEKTNVIDYDGAGETPLDFALDFEAGEDLERDIGHLFGGVGEEEEEQSLKVSTMLSILYKILVVHANDKDGVIAKLLYPKRKKKSASPSFFERGEVSLILDARPSIVNKIDDFNYKFFPELLHRVMKNCKQKTLWEIMRNNVDIFEYCC